MFLYCTVMFLQCSKKKSLEAAWLLDCSNVPVFEDTEHPLEKKCPKN
jgi:hypothetical protein